LLYGLYTLQNNGSRFTFTHSEHAPPLHRGVLSEHDWTKAALNGIEELKADSVVWKQGRETGITYNMIGGTHALYMKTDKLCDEFWVLQDAWATILYAFAEYGDSDSLVTTINGDAVDIVLED
jgi:hypothetical protein